MSCRRTYVLNNSCFILDYIAEKRFYHIHTGCTLSYAELKIKYVKFQNYTFMKIKKYFMKDKNLYLKKSRTLGA